MTAVNREFYIYLIVILASSPVSFADLDVDYSHTVTGQGTVISDYQMASESSMQASGGARGYGDLVSRHSLLANRSSVLQVTDEFLLSQIPPGGKSKRPTYPGWPGPAGRFRLSMSRWEKIIELAPNGVRTQILPSGPRKVSEPSSMDMSALSLSKNSTFEFGASWATDSGYAFAGTKVSDPVTLDVDAYLLANKKSFDFNSTWFNSSSAVVRSRMGQPNSMIYEEEASVTGGHTGRKNLQIVG